MHGRTATSPGKSGPGLAAPEPRYRRRLRGLRSTQLPGMVQILLHRSPQPTPLRQQALVRGHGARADRRKIARCEKRKRGHWACRTNKGLRTFKERATMKKPLMKKTWGAWGWGAVGAGNGCWRYACVDVLGVDLFRGRARVRVAARRSIPFLAPGFHRLKMTFTCPPFTYRPTLPLGLPHQQRTCFGATFFARDKPYASEEKVVVVAAAAAVVVVVVVRRRPFSRHFKL